MSIRTKQLRKLIKWTIVLVLAIALLHPGRFSESQWSYDQVDVESIVSNLQLASSRIPLPESEALLPPCDSDMTLLKSWTPPSLNITLEGSSVGHPEQKQKTTRFKNSCRPRYRSTLIIPYRDRPHQLDRFLAWIHPLLQAQKVAYTIAVVEQLPGKDFNRAALFNVGFIEMNKRLADGGSVDNCFIFHDIDLLPMNAQNFYACSKSGLTHLSVNVDTFRFNLPYWSLFGGAVAVKADIFKAVNGFSNKYFGWGGEDDDFYRNRLRAYGYDKITRYSSDVASYTMLPHKKADASTQRMQQLEEGLFTVEEDGLNSINYDLVSVIDRDIYVHILVAL